MAIAPGMLILIATVFGIVGELNDRKAEVAERAQPELTALVQGIKIYSIIKGTTVTPPWLRNSLATDPNHLTSIATLIAARGQGIIDRPDFNERTEDLLDDDERELARSALREHPLVNPEELKKAEARYGYIFRPRPEQTRVRAQKVVPILFGVMLGSVALANLGSILVFGISPGLRLFGLAVIDPTGAPARRLRLSARFVLAWSPFVLIITVFFLSGRGETAQNASRWAMGILFLIWMAGFIHAIRHPARGLHDQVAGTRVVPQ
jgi:uncharacterized RDD family membrane protein YckC